MEELCEPTKAPRCHGRACQRKGLAVAWAREDRDKQFTEMVDQGTAVTVGEDSSLMTKDVSGEV